MKPEYKLETENAELRRQIAEVRVYNAEAQEKLKRIHESYEELIKENSRLEEKRRTKENAELRRQLDELKRQLAEGELIPLWVVRRGKGLSVNPGDGRSPTPMSAIGDEEFIWEAGK